MTKIVSRENLSRITGLPKAMIMDDVNNGVLKIKRYRSGGRYEISLDDLMQYCGMMHYSYCGKERSDTPENVKARFEKLPAQAEGGKNYER
jgi:hypothetical protein